MGWSSAAAAATAPANYAAVQNRVLVIHHPNGNVSAYRILAGGTFEASPGEGNGTPFATYSVDGLPAGQGKLVLWTSFGSGVNFFAQTNRYTLTFQTATTGTFVREYNNSNLPNLQRFEGPFELSTASNIVPLVGVQPESMAIGAGRSLSLSVSAAGFSLTYQWYKNGQVIPNATQNLFRFNSFSASDAGRYHVVVTNPLGTAVSEAAQIELAQAPVIVRQPAPASGYEGSTAQFSVQATGTPPPAYEWMFRGSPLFGAANAPTLELKNITAAMGGDYSVRVVNGEGSVTSVVASLTVRVTATNVLYRGRPWVKIFSSRDPVPGTANTFGPLKSPFEPQFTLRDKTVHVIARGDNDVPVTSAGAIHRGLFRWRDGALTTLVFTNTARPSGGNFEDVFYLTDEEAGGMNFGSGSMYEFRDGTLREIVGPNTPAPGRTEMLGGTGSYARRGSSVAISASIMGNAGLPVGAGIYLHDGTRLSRICDDTTDLPGVMPGYGGRTTEDAINFDGTTLVFATVASLAGGGGVYRSTTTGNITKLIDSGDLLPGLTNAVVGFGDVDVEGGTIFAIIGTRVGTAPNFSTANRVVAFPEVGPPQVITTADYVVAAGPQLAYFGSVGSILRWSAGTLESVITSALVLDGKRINRLFDVEAQGDDIAIGVEFQDGSVGVYANFGEPSTGTPRILDQPKHLSVPESAPATFTVAAAGAAPLSYQWRRAGVPIPGATSPTFQIDSTRPADAVAYDVEIRNGAGSVVSSPANLILTAPPERPIIFSQPGIAIVPVGSPAELRVLAAGAPPLTYTWRMGPLAAAVPIPGATGPSYTTTLPTNALFSVVIANASGSVTSTVAQVNVLPILTREPQNQTVAPGGKATFEVVATGFPSFRYFWFKNNAVIAGQTNSVLTLSNVQESDAGSYSVTILGTGGGSLRSSTATLVVGTGGGGNPTPTPVQLGAPAFVGGELRFVIPTTAGSTYEVQKTPALVAGSWTTLQTISGDGTAKTVAVPAGETAGFVRIQTR